MNIRLASASPRRKELLEQIGIPFEIKVVPVDEQIEEKDPARLVEELSKRKARAAFSIDEGTTDEQNDLLVIGADTVVSCKGEILGKPSNCDDAKRMLRLLSGREHRVYTGVTLRSAFREVTFHEETVVYFYPITDKEIDEYIESGEPFDKAGSYAIQGIGTKFIRGIQGDYNNVVGLPVARVYQLLLKIKQDQTGRRKDSHA
jgi:septum formation protein